MMLLKNAYNSKNAFNTGVNEVKNKIPKVNNLASTTALTAVENKIPKVSNLVKKTDYNTKLNKIEKILLLIMIMINISLLQNLII